MELILIIGFVFGLIFLFFIQGIREKRRKERTFVENLKKNYGKMPVREYRDGILPAIKKFSQRNQDENSIDDITWNDLDMDSVFKQINHTWSSAGEEYLYYCLRNPKMNESDLLEMEKKIQFFAEHETDRIKMQTSFARIGRTGKHSLFEYLELMEKLEDRSNMKHIFAIVVIILSVLIMVFGKFSMGILIFCGALIYNIITYFKEKSDIDPYITSFDYIIRMLRSAKLLEETKCEIYEEELERIHKLRIELNEFTKYSSLMATGYASGSSNPLDVLVDYFKFAFHIDLMRFNFMLSFLKKKKEQIIELVSIMGYMEAMISVCEFRASLNTWCIPEFREKQGIEAVGLYHSEIVNPVANDLFVEKPVLITGSNASGKSTFLKTVAINAILAQTIHTCSASEFRTKFYRVYTSMALRDNLVDGESYYMVEIKSMKRILDAAAKSDIQVLCFVDEVLRGTNTVERISASCEILKVMAEHHVFAFAATHDIELTKLLQNEYVNYHFEEKMQGNDVTFEYRIMEGPATTRNAIRLLSSMGYDQTLTENAEKRAQNFLATGQWE